jgi:hypothetical protein
MRSLLRIPVLLLVAASALAATPVGTPGIGAAPGVRGFPAIAAHAGGFVTIWADERGVMAARLDGEGTLLDPFPLPVAASSPVRFGAAQADRSVARTQVTAWGGETALASNGRSLLAAWNCGDYLRPAICTAVIDPATMTSRRGATLEGAYPEIAWSGSAWAVAYYHSNFDPLLRVCWLDEEGAPFRTYEIGSGVDATIASTGTTTLVAWRHGSLIAVRAVEPAGAAGAAIVLSPALEANAFDARPKIATDGERFLTVWRRGGPDPHVLTVPLDGTGAPAAAPTRIDAPGWIESLAWAGSDYLAVATDGGVFYPEEYAAEYVVRFTRDGVRRESNLIAMGCGRNADGDIASNGSATVAVWASACIRRYRAVEVPDYRIEAMRVDGWLPAPSTLLSIGTAAQLQPVVASTATAHLVAWTEVVNGISRAFYSILDKSLRVVTPARPVASNSGDQRFPAVASDGTSFLIAWTTSHPENPEVASLHGSFISASGDYASSSPLAENVTHGPIALGHDGLDFFAVWTAADGTLASAHFDRTSGMREWEPTKIGEAGYNPSVAWNGIYFLLAWETLFWNPECRITCAPENQIRTMLLHPSGVRAVAAPTVALDFRTDPSLVWNGSTFTLFASGLEARQFSARGEPVGDPVKLYERAGARGEQPAAGWDGSAFILAWRDPSGAALRLDLSPALEPRNGPQLLWSAAPGIPQPWFRERTVAVAPDGSVLVHHVRRAEAPFLGVPELVIEASERPLRRRTVAR